MAKPSSADIEELFRSEGPKIWRALLAYAGDPDVANDAVAEAFAQALAHASRLHSPAAWLWRTAFVLARAELKRRSQVSNPGVGARGDDTGEANESWHDLVAALRQISPNQRAAVILHDYADRPSREIASILGISTATVRVHVSQGRRRLRNLLEGYR